MVNNGMQLILDGLYKCQNGRIMVNILLGWCWKLFPVMIWYHCDITEKRFMSDVQHRIIVSRLCIHCLLCNVEFGKMESATRRDTEGTLRARENSELPWMRFVKYNLRRIGA